VAHHYPPVPVSVLATVSKFFSSSFSTDLLTAMSVSSIEFQTLSVVTEYCASSGFAPSASKQAASDHIPGTQSQMHDDLHALEREIESTLRKCEMFQSVEVAWRNAIGPITVASLVFQSQELTEKLQAAEQDFVDNSENQEAALQRIQEAIEKRHTKEECVAARITDRCKEIDALKQQAAAFECKMSQIQAAEDELLTSNRHLLAQLTGPSPGSEISSAMPPSKDEARRRLLAARRSAAQASRTAAQAEAALMQARKDLSNTATTEQKKIGEVFGSWAFESGAAESPKTAAAAGNMGTSSAKLNAIAARASLWRGLCEESQALARKCQTKATRASLRLEAAERSAERSRKNHDKLQEATSAATAEVDAMKNGCKHAAKQRQLILGATLVLACVTLVQMMGDSCRLVQDAPTLICFVAGALCVKVHRSFSSSLRRRAPVSTPAKCLADPVTTCS